MTLELESSWEFHKDTIRTLYIVRQEPLKDVILHMREVHGFDKSKSQYENQFRKWGLRKNSKGSRWKDVQRKCQAREKQGKKNAVYKNGRRVDDGKLIKERRHDFRKPEEWCIAGSHPKTPEGFVIHTPLGVDIPPLLVNNIPSLQLFQHLQSFARTQKGAGRRPQSSSLAISQQHFSNEESLELVPRFSESHSRADLTPPSFNWMAYFADLEHEEIVSNGYARLESMKTILARSRFQNTGKAHSLQSVPSIIYLASNNLLGYGKTVPVFEAIRECGDDSLFKAIISSKSLAVKAIAQKLVGEAIASCDLSFVKAILDIGVDLNPPDKSFFEKPLAMAIRADSVEIAKLLLTHGADVNGRDICRVTMLMRAVQSTRPELVKLILSSGADVNAFSWLPTHSITALQQATQMGNYEIAQLLLCWGADVNSRPDPAERTALESAASTSNLSLVNLLLDCGAHDCMSALPAAIYVGNRKIVQLLWSHAGLECNRSDVIIDKVSVALQAAASTGDKELVNFFLDAGADVNASPPEKEGKSALQAAVYAGDLEMVQQFLDLGANVNISPARIGGLTPLQEAIWCENNELVRFLLDSGAEINADAAEVQGYTALQAAIAVGNHQLARDLIILGAEVNAAATTFGASALEAAVEGNDFDLVRLILDSGANDTGHWRDALVSAISHNYDVQSVKLLLDYGFDINENRWNDTPILALAVEANKGASTGVVTLLLEHRASDLEEALVMAAKVGDLDHIELLLDRGTDINATIPPGRGTDTTRLETTALSAAASSGDVAVVQFLLSKGASDVTGALHTTAGAGNIELATLFLHLGANVNAFKTNEWGIETTALEEAATSGNVKVLRLLLDSGAKVDSDANPGSRATALQRAAMVGNLGVVDELLQRGADVNAAPRGDHGRTALEGAAENGRLDIVQLLINVQADVQNSKALEFARRRGHEAVVELLQRST